MPEALMLHRPNLLEEADSSRIVANSKLEVKAKAAYGQYMTPLAVSAFMASLFSPIKKKEIRLLDPGAGVGSLTAAFIDALGDDADGSKVDIDTYEIDPVMQSFLSENMELFKADIESKGGKFSGRIIKEDFIIKASRDISNLGGLWEEGLKKYTHCIINPPYKKISSNSIYRSCLRSAGIETVNLYSAFVALAIKLLEENGELVAIIPRSFCNGLYYKPFREFLLNSLSIRRIHIFESRTDAFKDDEVLQENIILYGKKKKQEKYVEITSSTDSSFNDLTMRRVEFSKLVNPGDNNSFIHIATSDFDQNVADQISFFDCTLDELGLAVSTGPVVDFRLKDHLYKEPQEDSCPLIYPAHFDKGRVEWPKLNQKKPNAISLCEQSKKWLFPNGIYTLTKRFSSKEEKKRLVAVVYDGDKIKSDFIGFENHLNVFHSKKNGLDLTIAKGLSIYLNSTLLDLYFRQFSGHTQVNVTDLRQLYYPDQKTLRKWGKLYDEINNDQSAIDALITSTIREKQSQEIKMNVVKAKRKLEEALQILKDLGFPRAQQNERSALTLLALLDVKPEILWSDATSPLMGITPIMDFSKSTYGKEYAPNTRETFRRQTMHQFVDAGLASSNPDKPDRPINSPKWVYQITPETLELIKSFGTKQWENRLSSYLKEQKTLAAKYAKHRDMEMIPLTINENKKITLSPGEHSQLIKDIIEEFGPRYAPGSDVLYVGDTGSKLGHHDADRFDKLGLAFDDHGKFPDVVLYFKSKHWLLLIESVTSHGPVDAKRHGELLKLFKGSKAGLVFVTAFPNRNVMAKYLPEISWETEVWVADAPSHLIHFNGERFLGPYKS